MQSKDFNILLDKELKAQTDITKTQYQKLDDIYEFDKIIKTEKPTLGNYNKLELILNSNYIFYKYYRDGKKVDNLSLGSKHSFLANFFEDLNKFNLI